jgi:hypothetical protein
MSNAFYSLIQFCPDPGRQEAFNIGSVVFCPKPHSVDVRLALGFGVNARGSFGFDAALFEASKHAFKRRLLEAGRSFREGSDLESFRASGTNPIRLTTPRAMVLRDMETDAQGIFDALVGGPRPEADIRPARGLRMVTQLKQAFMSRGIAKLVETRVDVVVPAFGTRLKVPFAFQNGRFNLIEPVDFSIRDEAARAEGTSWYAVSGKSIFDTPDIRRGPMQLLVVARLPAESDAARRVMGVLADYSVDCRPFSDPALDCLAAEIRGHSDTRPGLEASS